MKDLTAFSGEKIRGSHTWGKEMHAQFIHTEVFKPVLTRSGIGKPYQSTNILLFIRTLNTCIQNFQNSLRK